MKLEVRNDWENYIWSADGIDFSVHKIKTVTIDDREYTARAATRLKKVYDHGHTYVVKTYDLEIRVDVADVPVWVSLYDNPKLLSKVRDIY